MAAAALAGCYVISLRPVGAHASLRRAARAHGARLLALSPWKLLARDDPGTRESLRDALACGRVLFTSPAAVRSATALARWQPRPGQAWFAVGDGTASALRRAGVASVQSPRRMDSEGLLALPDLQDVRGASIGLVTAPGGRDRIARVLQERGARVVRADVYARIPITPSPRAIAALQALEAPAWLALSSGDALERILAALPADALACLLRARVVAASDRLAALARARGFPDITRAASARPRDLLAVAARARLLPLA